MIEEEEEGTREGAFLRWSSALLAHFPRGHLGGDHRRGRHLFPLSPFPFAAAVVIVDSMSNVAWVDRPDRQKINFHINVLKY